MKKVAVTPFEEALKTVMEHGPTDGPVHDPFEHPAEVPDGILRDAINRLKETVPAERHREVGVVSTRSSRPKYVVGAKPLAACSVCSEKVWVAPSSVQILDQSMFFCTECVIEKLLLLPAT